MDIIDDGGKLPDAKSVDKQSSTERKTDKAPENGMLSQANVGSDTTVPAEEISTGGAFGMEYAKAAKDIVITADDKIAFIDSVVNNTRFEREYKMFGGKVSVTIRSITAEEANALAAWAFRKSVSDPTWPLSGRGRRNILNAQVSKFNGVAIAPMKQPLFGTPSADGKTVSDPAWVESSAFWDDKSTAVIDAVMRCIADFDKKYATLCEKAEDENFWAPDTP